MHNKIYRSITTSLKRRGRERLKGLLFTTRTTRQSQEGEGEEGSREVDGHKVQTLQNKNPSGKSKLE